MNEPQPYRPIKCTNCGKKIAEGSLPALVEIKCPGCGVRNDLAAVAIDGDKRKPFADRVELEKKAVVNIIFRPDPYIEYGTKPGRLGDKKQK